MSESSRINNDIPKGLKVNYPSGKGDRDTRTNPRKYRDAPLWDNFGPNKKPTTPTNNDNN